MKVKIVEVGPRDGLQNESKVLNVSDRLEFINLLIKAGHQNIEVGSFVNPLKIPQMAGTPELIRQLPKNNKTAFWALVPNRKGFEDSLACESKHIAIFTAASETFNQKNINASIDESFSRFKDFSNDARRAKYSIRGYVSTAFGCPFEGKVSPKTVYSVVERLLELGAREISVGDTIGVANPKIVSVMSHTLLKIVGKKGLALHFHDTRGTALANIHAALEVGVRIFDSSAGGLGGCPYAPGAQGNVATEDLLYMLHGMGFKTGIDINRHCIASKFIGKSLGKTLPSRYLATISN